MPGPMVVPVVNKLTSLSVIVVVTLFLIGAFKSAQAAVIAIEDFDYTNGALAGNNGGVGWNGGWANVSGTAATVTRGIAQISFSTAGRFESSQATRQLSQTVGDTETDVWLRTTMQKTTTIGVKNNFGGIGFFDTGVEQGLLGNFWSGVAVDAWGVGSHGSQGEAAGELVTTLSDVILHIKFGVFSEIWINPTNTSQGVEGMGSADTTGGAIPPFNEILLRAGSNHAGTETWQYHDLILGETAADVGVTGTLPMLQLEIDRTTGKVTLNNTTGEPVVINFYSIKSSGNSLDPIGWSSLQDQDLPGFPVGDGTGNGWEPSAGSNSGELIESYLLGSSSIADSASILLGTAYDSTVDAQDISLVYSEVDGPVREVIATYVQSLRRRILLGFWFVLLLAFGFAAFSVSRRRGK